MPLAFYAIYLFDCKNEDTLNIVQLLELSNRIPQHKCLRKTKPEICERILTALFREDSKQKSAPTQLDNSFTPCNSAVMTSSGAFVVLGGAPMMLFGASMTLCGASVMSFGASLTLCGASMTSSGASMTLCGVSLMLCCASCLFEIVYP